MTNTEITDEQTIIVTDTLSAPRLLRAVRLGGVAYKPGEEAAFAQVVSAETIADLTRTGDVCGDWSLYEAAATGGFTLQQAYDAAMDAYEVAQKRIDEQNAHIAELQKSFGASSDHVAALRSEIDQMRSDGESASETIARQDAENAKLRDALNKAKETAQVPSAEPSGQNIPTVSDTEDKPKPVRGGGR